MASCGHSAGGRPQGPASRPTLQEAVRPLANKQVWLHAAGEFVNRPDVMQVIVVISPRGLRGLPDEVHRQHHDPRDRRGRRRRRAVRFGLSPAGPGFAGHRLRGDSRRGPLLCIADEWITAVFTAAEKSNGRDFAPSPWPARSSGSGPLPEVRLRHGFFPDHRGSRPRPA